MQKHTKNTSDTNPALARQLIVCTVALGIVGLVAWTLLGQTAPYHPDVYNDEVSRDSRSNILIVDDTN